MSFKYRLRMALNRLIAFTGFELIRLHEHVVTVEQRLVRSSIEESMTEIPTLSPNEERELHAKLPKGEPIPEIQMPSPHNDVMEELLRSILLPDILGYKLRQVVSSERSFLLLGDSNALLEWNLSSKCSELNIQVLDWDWHSKENTNLPDMPLVLCTIPLVEEEWNAATQLKLNHNKPVYTLIELLLPFATISMLQKKLDYFIPSFEQIVTYYLGHQFFGPLSELHEVVDLRGKRIIEFGPFEACQTAGLINLGAQNVDCIEARSENVIKTLAAVRAMEWDNVKIIMNDFHDVDRTKYGKYDLAFAHGVYYHSIAPFLFLENLISISDVIFIGGFCATETLPDGDFDILNYEGENYRVKRYVEHHNYFTAGVNSYGYFLHKDDLIEFFKRRNYSITILSDEVSDDTAGNFLRFVARKTQ